MEGLKWGQYVGSPALGAPAVGFTQTLNTSVQSLVCLNNDNVFALGHNSTLLTLQQAKPGESAERLLWSAALSWGYMDGCIRVCTAPESTPVCLVEHHTPDKVRYVLRRKGKHHGDFDFCGENGATTLFLRLRSIDLIPE